MKVIKNENSTNKINQLVLVVSYYLKWKLIKLNGEFYYCSNSSNKKSRPVINICRSTLLLENYIYR